MGPDNKELKAKDTEINSAGTGVTWLKSCFRWIILRMEKKKSELQDSKQRSSCMSI